MTHGIRLKMVGAAFLLVVVLVFSGCADPMYGLSRIEQQQVREWQSEGCELIVEKDPKKATALGVLPGGGSFYTNNPVWGVIDCLCWPYSVIWEPWAAPAAANRINYEATLDAYGP